MVIKYNEDNLEEYCQNKTLFVFARNDNKIPKWVDSANKTSKYLNEQIPEVEILEVDFGDKPKSKFFIAPNDLEYYPAMFYIENGEVENIYFGFGHERCLNFIKDCLNKN